MSHSRNRPTTPRNPRIIAGSISQSSFTAVTGIGLLENTQSDTALIQSNWIDKRQQLLDKRNSYSQNGYFILIIDVKKRNLTSRPTSAATTKRQTTPSPPLLPPPNNYNSNVIIHVFDEARNVKRDFHCDKELLLNEMKYFISVLEENHHQMNIDVHSDVQVFEKLMGYCIHKDIRLEPLNAVSILISSHFLQMAELEQICLKYIKDNIDAVIKVPIDFSCIQGDLLNRYCLFYRDFAGSLNQKKYMKFKIQKISLNRNSVVIIDSFIFINYKKC
jgi:hypothetical protein